MAENPHGYGQFIGQHYPQPSYPQMRGQSKAQSPYNVAPQAGAVRPTNHATSLSAFEYNSNKIPGLGLSGPSMTLTSFPLPAPQVPQIPQIWSNQSNAAQTNSQIRNQNIPPASLPKQPPPTYQQPINPLEEGELGEYEDLYDPKHLTNVSQTITQNHPSQPSNDSDNRNDCVGDADASSIYDPNEPSTFQDDEWEPSFPDRERSGSYSPYLSPREVYRKASVAKAVYRDSNVTDRTDSTKPPLRPAESSVVSQSSRTAVAASGPSSNLTLASASKAEPHANSMPIFRSPSEAKKKAQEAILGLWSLKVRYQDYIEEGLDANVVKGLFKELGLDVPAPKPATTPAKATRNLHYSAGNPITSSTVSLQPPSRKLDNTQAPELDDKQSEKTDNKDEDKADGTKLAQKSAAEERKDKIARKLAAIAQKTTAAQPSRPTPTVPASVPVPKSAPVPVPVAAPVPPASAAIQDAAPAPVPVSRPSSFVPLPVSAPSPAPPTVSTPPPASVVASAPSPAPIPVAAPNEVTISTGTKSEATTTPSAVYKRKTENTAILQRKLAALKKKQAQSAAEKALAASKASSSPPSPADRNTPDVSRNGASTLKAAAATIQPVSNQQLSSVEIQDKPKDESIPGLSLPALASSQPSQGPSRGLKRPVASDFDSYTPRFEIQKRSRTMERLIIDVSDDEDVEMDMGSPTDEQAPSVDSGSATRQPLGAFQPLSEGPNWGQRLSPASSSAPTPPVGGARIGLLQKRIEETRRLIAEKEAKKAAKKAMSPRSAKSSSPAPQLQPVTLPKFDKANVESKTDIANRRDRIVSYELPTVNATLKEKQDRIKQLLAEAARLEQEVHANLEKQQKLTAEVECLVETPGEHSPQSDAQPPQSAPSTTSAHEASQAPASESEQDSREEHLGEQQTSLEREPTPTSSGGDMDIDLNNDEALQAAILTDNTPAMDLPMADADVSVHDADVARTQTADVSRRSLPIDNLSQTVAAEVSSPTELPVEGISIKATTTAEVTLPEVELPATTSLGSQPDLRASESDVSMQQSGAEQSGAELSQSDDESYEPTPAQISDSRGFQGNEQESTEVINCPPLSSAFSLTTGQVVDAVLEEPNPNHTSRERKSAGPKTTSDEVKYRSFEVPLQLTNSQDDAGKRPPPEDLLAYKSPLSYFRAYRFHPKFFDEVPGGLKSLTFSSKIDPMRELCPQVLAGEPCPNGARCEYQHLDTMVLPDAEIITQLGSADMFAGETKTKFITGLKRVLNDLKANRVKDFDRITKAIVKHRQEFLGDKTKVLALDCEAT